MSTETAQKCWIDPANDPETDFPIQNLPYGVFRHHDRTRIGLAIGDRILDLEACAENGLFSGLPESILSACRAPQLNALMSLGAASWSELRRRVRAMLDADRAGAEIRKLVEPHLVPMRDAAMQLPAQIGDYTDFYASIHHATRVGKLFRPDAPLLPNYKHIPIAYHGRASSIVISGEEIRRPSGQTKPPGGEPAFGPARSLDYELEVGMFIGPGNALGESISIAEAEQHIFGLCLLNDWSARDIQSWEYQPLGPFLAKNFATTISPWIIPMDALAPYHVPAADRPTGDPALLPYLSAPGSQPAAIDLTLEVYLQSEKMRESGVPRTLMSRSNLRHLYWTLAQMIAHHTSNGCNLRPGDLLATGTISGPDEGSEGCLLEKTHSPEPIRLPGGETRLFLEDGDQVTLRAYAQKAGLPRMGFGECTGTIAGAIS